MEPAITEAVLEEKMLGILGKTFSGLLSSMLKNAMVQAMPPSLAAPTTIPALAPVTPVVEVDYVALSTAPPQDPLPQVDLQCGSPKYLEATHVDQPEAANNLANKNQVQQSSPADVVCVEGPSHDSQTVDDEVNIACPIFVFPMLLKF